MSRFAEALKRARSGSVLGAEDDHPGDPIRFFAPGQPAVVAPWDVERDRAEPPASASLNAIHVLRSVWRFPRSGAPTSSWFRHRSRTSSASSTTGWRLQSI